MSILENKIAGKYVMGPKIGSGSFGEVYLVNTFGTSEIYALKKEDEKSKHLQLLSQARILKAVEGGSGFARLHWHGNEGKYNIMVMDLLGPSVEDLFVMCGKRLSLKTTLMLADQFLQRIEWLHSKDYIHRDIKPENFLMGINKRSHIAHIIDFGLSKKYRDGKTHQHIAYKENKTLTGTARYASINAHLGIEQSRRDDLESIGYVLIYLLQGRLPWQGIRANNKVQKYQKIMEKKMAIPVEAQCKQLPIEFSIYLNYTRALKFEDKPNYIYLRSLFLELLERLKLIYDFSYDWCSINAKRELEDSKLRIQLKNEESREPISAHDSSLKSNTHKDIREEEEEAQHLLQPSELQEEEIEGEENLEEEEEGEQFEVKEKRLDDLEEKKNRLLFDEQDA